MHPCYTPSRLAMHGRILDILLNQAMKLSQSTTAIGCVFFGFLSLMIINVYFGQPHSSGDILKQYLQDRSGVNFFFTFLICRIPVVLIAVGGIMSLCELRNRHRCKEKVGIGTKRRSAAAKLELWFSWLGFFALIYVLIGFAFCVSDFHF